MTARKQSEGASAPSLKLDDDSGALVQPLAFDDPTRAELTKWLHPSLIEELREATETGRHLWQLRLDMPTVGEQADVLHAIASAAAELEELIRRAPPIAAGVLAGIAHKHAGGITAHLDLLPKLTGIAQGCREWIETHPEQGRRASPTILVGTIDGVLSKAGIAVSVAEGSRFFKIARLCFVAAGVLQSPAGAIRAYQEAQGTKA